MKVLSTKTLSGDVMKYAAGLGIEVDCAELIETRPLEFDAEVLGDNFDALVFTSANAVTCFFANEKAKQFATGKIIYSTPSKTKKTLSALGFGPDKTAENSAMLADLIIAESRIKSVLHPCGNLRLDVLENKIISQGKQYFDMPVYKTLPKKYVAEAGKYEVIMFYSPSEVDAFCTDNKLDKNCLYSCIGETTAGAIRKRDAGLTVITPRESSPKGMIDTIDKYFKTGGRTKNQFHLLNGPDHRPVKDTRRR